MTIYFSSQKTQLKAIDVSDDDSKNKSLMTLLLEAKYPVASSCKGDGICSKCRVTILEGSQNLSPLSDLETKTKQRNKVAEPERLSCQVFVCGNITIDTNYW